MQTIPTTQNPKLIRFFNKVKTAEAFKTRIAKHGFLCETEVKQAENKRFYIAIRWPTRKGTFSPIEYLANQGN